jgi:hypothetical protein
MGCHPENDLARRSHTDSFNQEPPANVDILWVIDNSPSMREEQEEVAARFSEFVSSLEETNIDFHLGVITTDISDGNPDAAKLIGEPNVLTDDMPYYQELFEERVQVGTGGSMREQGLEAAWRALSEPLVSDANRGFLREDAVLAVVYVSDEDDCSDRGALGRDADQSDCYGNKQLLVPVRTYVDAFLAMKQSSDQVLVSSIVGPRIAQGCDDSVPGERYIEVANNTGGIIGDICEQDFTGIMDEMGLSVSGVRSSFQLTYSPVLTTLEVMVSDRHVIMGEANGWTYDEDTRYLTFHGDAVPPRGATVTASYEIGAS